MASRTFNQFLSTLNFNPCYIEGSFQIGSTGAPVVNSFSGAGIAASSTITVQKLGTGYYMLQLQDRFNRIVGWNFMCLPGPSSTVAQDNSGTIVTGQAYQILGGTSAVASGLPTTSTNWYQLGLNPALDPRVGQIFIATSAASQVPGSSAALAGQGLCQAIGQTGIDSIEVLPCVNLPLAPTSGGVAFNATGGAQIYFQTLRSTSTTNTMQRFNPTSATIRYNLFLRNSSRGGYNEATTSN